MLLFCASRMQLLQYALTPADVPLVPDVLRAMQQAEQQPVTGQALLATQG